MASREREAKTTAPTHALRTPEPHPVCRSATHGTRTQRPSSPHARYIELHHASSLVRLSPREDSGGGLWGPPRGASGAAGVAFAVTREACVRVNNMYFAMDQLLEAWQEFEGFFQVPLCWYF